MSSDISKAGRFYMATMSHQWQKQVRHLISPEMLQWHKNVAQSTNISAENEGHLLPAENKCVLLVLSRGNGSL
jgi:hypothetical protein